MALTGRSLRGFLQALASRQPTPGGGSAAALSAALGASLYVMVCRILVAREPPPARRRQLQRWAVACEQDRRALLRLVEHDARAYGRLVAANRSRHGERRRRQAQRQAMHVPLAICDRAFAALRRAPALRRLAGPALASDVVAGSALLVGGFVAAAAMVVANLEGMDQRLPREDAGPRPSGQQAQAAEIRRRLQTLLRQIPRMGTLHG